jgi:RimJ/RimL family protein N-acetyltransferase
MEQIMNLRLAEENEKDIILNLYNEAKKEKYCVWNDEYPTIYEIDEDFKTNNLFVYTDNDEIIGAISIVPINEMDEYDEWQYTEKSCEIARIVIRKKHQGKGLALDMVESIFPVCKKKGFNAIHLSCQCDNIPANKTYQKLGFKNVGKAFMYENYYYLLEKNLI